MLDKEYGHKKDCFGMVVTIEEGTLKVIKKRFRGLNVEYLDVLTVASNLGYDLNSDMSEASQFILTRELERLLLEKLLENEKDVIYIVPKYTPDIKKSVSDILKKNNIQVDLVVGLLMI
ncbi:MAG: hypothetical protein RL348_18 [Bacteroidota bacterium]|jgi:hypothetical protein